MLLSTEVFKHGIEALTGPAKHVAKVVDANLARTLAQTVIGRLELPMQCP